MFEGLLTVKYLTSKNCFCCLSSNNFKHLQNNVLKLMYNDNVIIHVSVISSGGPTIDDQSIGINSLYAKAVGLDESSLVAVSEIAKPPTIQSVTISTTDENDHYVLESLAESVQSTLLEQIHVLTCRQKFIIWIGKTIHVTVSVCNIKPISPGKIDNLTEVIIKPPGESFKPITNDIKTAKSYQSTQKHTIYDFLSEYNNVNKAVILRVAPYKELIDNIGELCKPFNVFVFRKSLPNLENTITNCQLYLVKLLTNENSEKTIYTRLYIFEDFVPGFKLNKIAYENIFVGEEFLKHFNCELGSRVLLEPHHGSSLEIKELEICTQRNYSFDIKQTFQQYLADNCRSGEFILNAEVVLIVENKFKCFVRFQPYEAKFCIVTQDVVRDCKLVVINEVVPETEVEEKEEFIWNKYEQGVANFKEIIENCLFLLTYNTQTFCKMDNIIITGRTGTGKTTLLKIISNILSSSPYFIYTRIFHCKTMKGKTVESLHKLFTVTFFELIHHQPSLLILDDFEVLCEHVNEGDALAQNAVYFDRVSDMLAELFKKFCEHNAVGILTTAELTSKLHKNIYATRGNYLFKNVYSIEQLSKNDRRKLLEFFFNDYNFNIADLEKLIEKAEGFVIRDMADWASKTLFELYQDDFEQNSKQITKKYCEKALEIVTEISLSDANLHAPGEKDLDDIGGLAEVKKILTETMLWPAKYPNLFKNAPLRLPSGLLFYGPPGTGKTILAGAAAKHFGLRLISIKGPELLSKYIGASEQAVRDVFQRAQSAKPCIVFFDEFDSLAPRRGHDNTGVTDRVVNQLLTQLDGVESLSGVFVLAATSRPDLLDPALLRPGRLDIHIPVLLPDELSRLEILKVLSKSLNLCQDVDLREVARATEGFSGADLQSVLYTAQLDCVKGLLEDEENTQEFEVEIQQNQLTEAVKSTRPSLSQAERRKYEQIYKNFEGRGSSDFKPGSRATLA